MIVQQRSSRERGLGEKKIKFTFKISNREVTQHLPSLSDRLAEEVLPLSVDELRDHRRWFDYGPLCRVCMLFALSELEDWVIELHTLCARLLPPLRAYYKIGSASAMRRPETTWGELRINLNTIFFWQSPHLRQTWVCMGEISSVGRALWSYSAHTSKGSTVQSRYLPFQTGTHYTLTMRSLLWSLL